MFKTDYNILIHIINLKRIITNLTFSGNFQLLCEATANRDCNIECPISCRTFIEPSKVQIVKVWLLNTN